MLHCNAFHRTPLCHLCLCLQVFCQKKTHWGRPSFSPLLDVSRGLLLKKKLIDCPTVARRPHQHPPPTVFDYSLLNLCFPFSRGRELANRLFCLLKEQFEKGIGSLERHVGFEGLCHFIVKFQLHCIHLSYSLGWQIHGRFLFGTHLDQNFDHSSS